jgi:hypothetical protein
MDNHEKSNKCRDQGGWRPRRKREQSIKVWLIQLEAGLPVEAWQCYLVCALLRGHTHLRAWTGGHRFDAITVGAFCTSLPKNWNCQN